VSILLWQTNWNFMYNLHKRQLEAQAGEGLENSKLYTPFPKQSVFN
jgi:hypothetical protein